MIVRVTSDGVAPTSASLASEPRRESITRLVAEATTESPTTTHSRKLNPAMNA